MRIIIYNDEINEEATLKTVILEPAWAVYHMIHYYCHQTCRTISQCTWCKIACLKAEMIMYTDCL